MQFQSASLFPVSAFRHSNRFILPSSRHRIISGREQPTSFGRAKKQHSDALKASDGAEAEAQSPFAFSTSFMEVQGRQSRHPDPSFRLTVGLVEWLRSESEVGMVALPRDPCNCSCKKLLCPVRSPDHHVSQEWRAGAETAAGPDGSGVSADTKTGSNTGPRRIGSEASSKAGKHRAEIKLASGMGAGFSSNVIGNIKEVLRLIKGADEEVI